jgi:hypothetical protein
MDLSHFFSFLIYAQSVGLLGWGMSPSQGRYLHAEEHKNTIKEHTDINALNGILTQDPSVWADEDSSCFFRPYGHCDRLSLAPAGNKIPVVQPVVYVYSHYTDCAVLAAIIFRLKLGPCIRCTNALVNVRGGAILKSKCIRQALPMWI